MEMELPSTFVPGFHDESAVRRMPYRAFGRLYSDVSVLALGTSALAGVFGDTVSLDRARDVVVGTVASGVNVIDTAPWYGHGKSEEILGRILPDIPRAAYRLHTKVGRYDADVERMFDFRAERMESSVEASLARLRCEYIDLIQVHDPEFCPDIRIILDETLPALARLRERGKVRAVGVTGYPVAILGDLVDRSPVALDSCLSYSRLALHDTSFADSGLIDSLHARGIGVINAAPLAMGLLTQAGPPTWHPAGAALRSAATAAARDCEANGTDLARLAMVFALRQPADTTMVSSADPSIMRANVELAATTVATNPDEPGEALEHRLRSTGLTSEEEALLLRLREVYFAPLQRTGQEHWEGVEIAHHFAQLGRRLWIRQMYPSYA